MSTSRTLSSGVTRAITPMLVDLRRAPRRRSSRANSAPVIARPSMPSLRAIASAVTAWSPVIIRTWMPGRLRLGDRRLRLRPRRVDDADEREQRQAVDERRAGRRSGRTSPGRSPCARSPARAGPARRGARSRPGSARGSRRRPAIGRRSSASSADAARASSWSGAPLTKHADDVAARARPSSGGRSPSACRRRRTAARRRAGTRSRVAVDVEAALLGEHDERALGRVADQLAVA